jgi:hypothetical protein
MARFSNFSLVHYRRIFFLFFSFCQLLPASKSKFSQSVLMASKSYAAGISRLAKYILVAQGNGVVGSGMCTIRLGDGME